MTSPPSAVVGGPSAVDTATMGSPPEAAGNDEKERYV